MSFKARRVQLGRINRRAAILKSAAGVRIEALERRLLFTSVPTTPIPIQLPEAPLPLQGVVATPTSASPQVIDTGYGFNQIAYFNNNTNSYILGNGANQTIAIVDPYGSPSLISDVKVFDQHWGISDQDANGNFFLTIQPLGGTNATPGAVTPNADWAEETALDVEWAHAVAPGAHVLLVQAPTNDMNDMLDSVAYAEAQKGVVVVSMSWGIDDFDESWLNDGFFVTPDGHQDSNGVQGGVTFVAASGDTSALEYPSASIDVIGVGGFTQGYTINGDLSTYAPWSMSGGGTSQYVNPPHVPLVALTADPNSGVWIYDSTPNSNGNSGWQVVGGTSFAAPAWAAYIAIIDQGIELDAGHGSLDSAVAYNNLELIGEGVDPNAFQTYYGGNPPTFPLWPMNGPIPDRTQIPDNGNTGFGSPNGVELTTDMLALANVNDTVSVQDPTVAPTLTFTTEPTDTTAGDTLPVLTIHALNADGTLDTGFNGSVTLSSQLIGSATSSVLGFGTASNGTVSFSALSINTTGDYRLVATATGLFSGLSSNFTISPNIAEQLAVIDQPGNSWQYAGLSTPVSVAVEDQFGNPIGTSDSTITVSVASGPSDKIIGATKLSLTNGTATFGNLAFATPGMYTLFIDAGASGSTTTDSFEVVSVPVKITRLFNGAMLSTPLLELQKARLAPALASAGAPVGAELTEAIVTALANGAIPFVATGVSSSNGAAGDGPPVVATDSVLLKPDVSAIQTSN